MNPIAKEKIYDELRRYHVEAFPDALSSDRMKDLSSQFGVIEEKVIGMLLSLVNGKAGFLDDSKELTDFRDKVANPAGREAKEEGNLAVFISKVNHLLEMLVMAKDANFQLRKVRIKKTA